jgi:hypothetical protein
MGDIFSFDNIMLGLLVSLIFGSWSYYLAKSKGFSPIGYAIVGAIVTFPIVIMLYKKKPKQYDIPKDVAAIIPYANMYSRGGLTQEEFKAIQRNQLGLNKKEQ